MNYPANHQSTELSTGRELQRYIVLRLVSNMQRMPFAGTESAAKPCLYVIRSKVNGVAPVMHQDPME
jgi:hypothetical protein